jgi:hypothetical protein
MIDGTREGEMDAAYMLRVDEGGNVVVECMCRGERDLKVGFIDRNVAWHWPWHDGWGRCGWRLFNKLCVGSQRIGDQLRRGRLISSIITVRLAGAHILSIWPYAPN